MEISYISFFYNWCDKDTKPIKEYYDFERELFADRYAICSSTYEDFKTRFRKRYLCGSCYDQSKLCGMLFIDELVDGLFYYLRVIGLGQAYRGKGITRKLLFKAMDKLPTYHQLAYVTESQKLISIISECYDSTNAFYSKDLSVALADYNSKLDKKIPNQWIDNYYQLADLTYSSGFFGLVERFKIKRL